MKKDSTNQKESIAKIIVPKGKFCYECPYWIDGPIGDVRKCGKTNTYYPPSSDRYRSFCSTFRYSSCPDY